MKLTLHKKPLRPGMLLAALCLWGAFIFSSLNFSVLWRKPKALADPVPQARFNCRHSSRVRQKTGLVSPKQQRNRLKY